MEKFKLSSRALWTTPLHAQGVNIPKQLKKLIGKEFFKADFSEIDGLDNLRNPSEVILKSQKNIAEIFGAKKAFYLINGATSGVIASFLALFKENDKVLIQRNSHLSIYNALVLTGVHPIWLNTDYDEFNLPKPFNIETIKKLILENPDIKGIFLTNPSYEGTVNNISEVAKLCKEKNIKLVVDEAHGGLFEFSDKLPQTAIKQGADISILSMHKGLSGLTQTGLLLLNNESINIQESLNLITSTSPSYPLLASIEGSVEHVNSKKGRKIIKNLIQNIEEFKASLSEFKNIKIHETADLTKLFIAIEGISGEELSLILNSYNIEDEFQNEVGVLLLTGMGTLKKKFDMLKKVLIKTSKKVLKEEKISKEFKQFKANEAKTIITPKEAFYKDELCVDKEQAKGKISKELIVPYPPGVPILIPGEKITDFHLEYIEKDIKIIKE